MFKPVSPVANALCLPVQSPDHRLLLHGKVENGSIQGIVVSLKGSLRNLTDEKKRKEKKRLQSSAQFRPKWKLRFYGSFQRTASAETSVSFHTASAKSKNVPALMDIYIQQRSAIQIEYCGPGGLTLTTKHDLLQYITFPAVSQALVPCTFSIHLRSLLVLRSHQPRPMERSSVQLGSPRWLAGSMFSSSSSASEWKAQA